MIFTINVGLPQSDKPVTVNDEMTVSEVLRDNEVSTSGLIQHNGTTLNANQLSKTLKELAFSEGDSLHVVKKLDNA